MRLSIVAAACLNLTNFPVTAATPAFDPRAWKGSQAGPLTQVLTIGSPHLRELPANFQRSMLSALLDKLAAYKPDVITHEGISGEGCDTLQRYAATYPDMFDTYCWGTDEARKATGLTVPEAMAQVEVALTAWPAQPSVAERRHLAALFLAAGDRPSAQVQWLRLPVAERREGDGVDTPLLKILTAAGAKPNETTDIVVVLAARLGLERVYAVDDHSADSIQARAGDGFGPALTVFWAGTDPAGRAEYNQRAKVLATPADMLDFYRYLARPATQRMFVTNDMGAALKQPGAERYGRQYVAWFETRNLRMVANIRSAFGNRPGARVLNIVGASHKAYYDAYLDMMSDVAIVDAEVLLK